MDYIEEQIQLENWTKKEKAYRVRLLNQQYNKIIKIECLNYYDEMVCFLVDNREHLFLMNDYIVTHNTRTMIADACTFSCNQLYNPEFGL